MLGRRFDEQLAFGVEQREQGDAHAPEDRLGPHRPHVAKGGVRRCARFGEPRERLRGIGDRICPHRGELGYPNTAMTADHRIAEPPAPPPPPLAPFLPTPRRSAAEEARTLVAANRVGSLATLSADGAPWASMVTYGALGDGSPVLCVSTLAEHGRNLHRDTRASLVVSADAGDGDPLDVGRVTLAGRAVVPDR